MNLDRLERSHPDLYEQVTRGPLSVADAVMLTKVRAADRARVLDLLAQRGARSAREALEAVFAQRGETVPDGVLQRPHRDVVIDEIRRVLDDAVAHADANRATAAIGDLRRAHKLSRTL